jgi:hypothetical protein
MTRSPPRHGGSAPRGPGSPSTSGGGGVPSRGGGISNDLWLFGHDDFAGPSDFASNEAAGGGPFYAVRAPCAGRRATGGCYPAMRTGPMTGAARHDARASPCMCAGARYTVRGWSDARARASLARPPRRWRAARTRRVATSRGATPAARAMRCGMTTLRRCLHGALRRARVHANPSFWVTRALPPGVAAAARLRTGALTAPRAARAAAARRPSLRTSSHPPRAAHPPTCAAARTRAAPRPPRLGNPLCDAVAQHTPPACAARPPPPGCTLTASS